MTREQAAFWTQFQTATGETRPEPAGAFRFGDSEDMADELLGLVLSRTKTATCSLDRWYAELGEPRPRAGEFYLVLDGRDAPAAIIRITEAVVKPMHDADAQFAHDEGEGDRTLEGWRTAHLDFFQREAEREGFVFCEDMDVLFERFELVWPK